MEKDQVTTRSVVGALFIAVIAAGSYPYMVLKMGLGIGFSMIALLLANIFIKHLFRQRDFNRYENNLVQTGVSAATASSFIVVVVCALEMLGYNLTSTQIATWITCTGFLGVFFTVPLREQFLIHDQLRFPDGTACAEVAEGLDVEDGDREGLKKGRALLSAATVTAVLTWLMKGFPAWIRVIPGSTMIASKAKLAVGMSWSPMLIATGVIIGLRVTFSILVGCLVCWWLISDWVISSGIALTITDRLADPSHVDFCKGMFTAITSSADPVAYMKENAQNVTRMGEYCTDMLTYAKAGPTYPLLVKWTMWPATAILVFAGITAMALRWRTIVGAFKALYESMRNPQESSVLSMRELIVGLTFCTIALMVVQYWIFGLGIHVTLIGIAISFFLSLIAVRATGDTGINPVSVMGSFMQLLMSVISPGIAANMAASGTAAGASAAGADMMHDLKTGYLLKANPRRQMFMQLLCIPIGAICVSIFYPLIRNFYGIGVPTETHPDPLTAPTSIKWKAFAELLDKGIEFLPPYALESFFVAGAFGALIAVTEWYFKDRMEPERFSTAVWIPSPMGIGIAFLLPAVVSFPIALGGIIGWVWAKVAKQNAAKYAISVAAGAAVAEAFLSGVVLPFVPILFGG